MVSVLRRGRERSEGAAFAGAHLFKMWVNLLCIASQSGGKLPSDDDLAFMLRMSVHDVVAQVDDLILAELIDLDPKGVRSLHNWKTRQCCEESQQVRASKVKWTP